MPDVGNPLANGSPDQSEIRKQTISFDHIYMSAAFCYVGAVKKLLSPETCVVGLLCMVHACVPIGSMCLTNGGSWEMLLTVSHQWGWQRSIQVYNSIKLGSSGPGRSTPLNFELHWIQHARETILFNFRTLKNYAN